jgi:hypothetical protein
MVQSTEDNSMLTRKDGIVIAIAIVVLVIGTATGSAYAMLGMAVAGLIVSAILYRGTFQHREGLIVLTATAVVTAVAFAAGFVLSVR